MVSRTIQARAALQNLFMTFRSSTLWSLSLFALALYTVGFWLLIAFGVRSSEQSMLIGDVGVLPVGAAAVLVPWLASRRLHLDPATRRAWRGMAVAFFLYLLGDALWAVIEIGFRRDPFPSVADLAYLAHFPVLLWALLQFPHTFRSRTERTTFWLDTMTVVVGGGMVIWHFVLRPTALTVASSPVAGILATAYPVGDLMLLLGLTITVFREPAAGGRRALSLIALALLLMVVSDVAFGISSLGGSYLSGSWLDGLWITAQALVAIAAATHILAPAEPARKPSTRAPRSFSLVPYFSVAVGYGLVVALARHQWDDPLGGMILGAVFLTVLVVARQIIAVQENAALHAERARRESEVRFRSLIQHASDVTVILSPDLGVQYCSPAITHVFGHGVSDIEGGLFDRLLHPDDHPAARALIAAILTGTVSRNAARWRLRHRNGSFLHVEVVITDLTRDPSVAGIVLNMRDVTERTQLEDQLAHQAVHDLLTGLPNQVLFRDRLRHALKRVARQHQDVSILLIDLVQFKQINDSLGRAVGDEVLRQVAERVTSAVRDGDTVARISGDEFAVLLDEYIEAGGAAAVANRVLNALRQPLMLTDQQLRLDARIGIATAPSGDLDADSLLRNGDLALHHAKQAPGGEVCMFSPEMHEASIERLELEHALRRAVEEEQFEVYYQPYFSLVDGTITGAEALVRWRHPTRGLVPPAVFIPLAEENGHIVPIGLSVLRTACRQVVSWMAGGLVDGGFTISVNLSARQLRDASLVQDVRAVLAETGLSPAQLVLEITESAVMHDPDQAVVRLEALRDLGLRLAVDDFGTGQSSLAYLRRFPVNVLKIDKSFVDVVERGGKETALVRSIVAMSRSLGMRTVAEGIEQPGQFTALRRLGCDTGQGYLVSRPLPAAHFRAWITSAAVREPDWTGHTHKERRSA